MSTGEPRTKNFSATRARIISARNLSAPVYRFLVFFLVILLPLSMILGCTRQPGTSEPESAFSSGEPVYYTPDPNDSKVQVLSAVVNTNAQTGEVFTELILQNTDEKECEVTFALPEISAGIDMDTLAVTTKSGREVASDQSEGEPLRVNTGKDRVLSLSIGPMEFTGITYTYKTKDNLSYKNTIGFDLTQLSEPFHDRIGHLEWTVDLSFPELFMVKEVFPVNFTASRNRVSVELDQFLVSNLLDHVYLVRTTQAELLDLAEGNAESVDKNVLPVFLVNNYRKWLKDPGLVKVFSDPTLLKLWLHYDQGLEPEECETLEEIIAALDDYRQYPDWYESKSGYDENCGYDFDTLIRYSAISSGFDSSKENIRPLSNLFGEIICFFAYYDPDCFDYSAEDLGLYSFDVRNRGTLSGIQMDRPALAAQMISTEPTVYAALMTELPDITGYSWNGDKNLLMESYFKTSPADSAKAGLHSYRTIFLREEDFSNQGIVREYLDALHVKAVVRLKVCSNNSAESKKLIEARGKQDQAFNSIGGFSYDGTEEYSFESFQDDLRGMNGYVISCEEPHKKEISVPIFTMYWGMASAGDQWAEDKTHIYVTPYYVSLGNNTFNPTPSSPSCALYLDRILSHEDPGKIIEARNKMLEESVEENEVLISKAREVLDLPKGVKDPEPFNHWDVFRSAKTNE